MKEMRTERNESREFHESDDEEDGVKEKMMISATFTFSALVSSFCRKQTFDSN